MQSRRNAAYAAQILRVRARVDAFAQARFATGSYRDADLDRFVAQVVPVALAGRRQVAALTDAHLAQLMSAKLGRPVRPSGPADTALLRGVDPAEVYGRPFKTVWWKLSEGLLLDAAVSAGKARLTDIVMGDLQLAKTTTAQQSMQSGGFPRFQRVLSGGPNCALCTLASTQEYFTEDLMPIHPGCNCDVEPLEDGEELDQSLIGDVHAAVEAATGTSDTGGRAPDYRKIVLVREHGELGPVLTARADHFTGPAAVA